MKGGHRGDELRKRTEELLHGLLRETIRRGASDLFLKTGACPSLRLAGEIAFMKTKPMGGSAMSGIAELLLGGRLAEFRETGEADLAYHVKGTGRFRVNIFRQRESTSAAFRHIPTDIPSFEELNLPGEQLQRLAAQTRGVVLVTGVTGSGKSTTLAALVDHMNNHYRRHIVTIEDPVEFVHRDDLCLIEQREVGIDTASFPAALKHVVRQSPDVILIGEMRDRVTIEAAINAAEIGHLVLSTLHTANTMQTLERIVSYFPPHQHELIRMQLANTMQGVLSQQLLRRADGQGRIPAVEVMMRSPTICELIHKGRTAELEGTMREDTYFGSRTYQQALLALYRSGAVDMAEALRASRRPQELKNEIEGLAVERSDLS